MLSPKDEVELTIEAPLAWIVINRPQARNALTLAAWQALAERVRQAGADDTVRVVIIRGAGDEAFIAGADITEFPRLRADAAMTMLYDEQTRQTLATITQLAKPVVAMINGLCFGGGCSVALACDLRYAAEHARFSIPATKLGLSYPFELGIERLVQIVGPAHAADMLLSARVLSSAEARRIGLVNDAWATEQLETRIRELAQRMAGGAPLTVAAHKLAIGEAASGNPNHDSVRAAALRCFDSEDYREGVASFLAKRAPVFRGR